MKLRLMVSEARYAALAAELTAKGFEIDDSADLILSEKNAYARHLIGRQEGEMFRLKTTEISHIESFAHEIVAHSGGAQYRISDTLRRLEEILDPQDFLRVSNSVIVSVNHIKSIKPALTQKYILTMTDGARVDVTRSYYYIFKDFLGI